MFLTREELKAMTNGKRPKEILEWLRREGFEGKFRIGLDGWPVVHEKVVEQIFGVGLPARGKRGEGVRLDYLKGNDGKITKESTRPT